MKKILRSKIALAGASAVALSLCLAETSYAQPKKVLVVTVTKGFRHSSIPTAEKVLGKLAESSGAFTVDYARVEPNDPQFKGPDNKPDPAKVNAAIEKVLAEKMSPDALKNYDGVIFANTTGDLPLPDKQAFLDWIKSGKAFIGMHSASDTFHGFPPFVEMLGGEFTAHHSQCEIDAINQDPKHPACKDLGRTFHVKDEIYLLKNFERGKVHGLLGLDKHPPDGSAEGKEQKPGDYPVAWAKMYGQGRLFYTSLGHREDVWDPNWTDKGKRDNPKEVSEAYQKHILGGIKWALGLEKGDAKPQVVP